MNHHKKEHADHWFLYSLSFHAILAALLFLSLFDYSLLTQKQAQVILLPQEEIPLRQRQQPQKKLPLNRPDQDAFTVPVPVMYYGDHLDPNKKPGQPGGTNKLPDSVSLASAEHQPHELKNNEQGHNAALETVLETPSETPPEPLEHEMHEEIQNQLINQPQKLLEIIPLTQLEASVISHPEKKIDAAPEIKEVLPPAPDIKKHEKIREKVDKQHAVAAIKAQGKATKKSSKEDTVRKKTLTLSDLFKNTTFPDDSAHMLGEGSGQPVVIREGDMRYYSVWAKFLQHLNDVVRFNRVKNKTPLFAWIQSGLVKNNIFCGITVTRDGKVLDIDLITSSGYQPFDSVCMADIWSASPFPPLPDSMKQEKARFEVRSYF